jgi:hypothetical protein
MLLSNGPCHSASFSATPAVLANEDDANTQSASQLPNLTALLTDNSSSNQSGPDPHLDGSGQVFHDANNTK